MSDPFGPALNMQDPPLNQLHKTFFAKCFPLNLECMREMQKNPKMSGACQKNNFPE